VWYYVGGCSSIFGSSPPFRRVSHSESRQSWSLQGIVLDIATTRRLTLTLTVSLTVSCQCRKWLKLEARRNGGPTPDLHQSRNFVSVVCCNAFTKNVVNSSSPSDNAAYYDRCYRSVVSISVCMSVTFVHPAKVVRRNEMPFGMNTRVVLTLK